MANDITVKFVDFWNGWDDTDNFLLDALRQRYNPVVLPDDSPDEPQLLFFSFFGEEHLSHSGCIKIYYTGENDVPNFNECDYAISFHDISFGHRHLRYPLYATYPEFRRLTATPRDAAPELARRRFCSFLTSNAHNSHPMRQELLKALNDYKPVASGGRALNNIGSVVEDKELFLSQYKFNLAIENSRLSGYVTEKLPDALAAHTVPIYWGDSATAAAQFNSRAYIDAGDFATPDTLLAAIAALDANPEAYLAMLRQPALAADAVADWDERLAAFLAAIATNGRRHIARYGGQNQLATRHRQQAWLFRNRLLRALARRNAK